MDIEYKGANCIVIVTKAGTAVIDPKLSLVGLKDYSGKMTVQLATHDDLSIPSKDALFISGPGEYEVAGMSVTGIATQRHTDLPEEGKRATIYRLDTGDVSLGVIGHTVGQLSESQAEELGMIDVLVVPVGGNGYTLDAHSAVQIIRQVEPRVVIPTHYADEALSYEVPQAELELFAKELGATPEPISKLKLKGGALPDVLTVYQLTRTA